jgi:hypothetical protein
MRAATAGLVQRCFKGSLFFLKHGNELLDSAILEATLDAGNREGRRHTTARIPQCDGHTP